MSSGWGWGVAAAVLFVLAMWHDKRRKARQGGVGVGPFVFVRTIRPASNVFRNIVVLAVVVALGWFFWYVMGTRCNGGC